MNIYKPIYSLLYHFKKKDNDLIIINSAWNKYFNFNSRYIFENLKDSTEYNVKFVINDYELKQKLEKEIGNYFITSIEKKDIRTIFSAKTWITSAGFPIRTFFCGYKRNIIKFSHGYPVKLDGYLSKSNPWYKKLLIKYVYAPNYSAVSACSEFEFNYVQKMFGGIPSKKVQMLGNPRFDFMKDVNNATSNLNNFMVKEKKEKFVLYAPTFRDYGKTEIFPFEDLDKEKLFEFLKTENIKIFVRLHHLESGALDGFQNEQIIPFGVDVCDEIGEVLPAFDLVISDFSSIFIEFLITQKPVMFILYDRDEYEVKRGLVEVYDKITPGPNVLTFDNFKVELSKLLADNSYYLNDRTRSLEYINQVSDSKTELSNYLDKILREES